MNVARRALTLNWLADGRLFAEGGHDSHNLLGTEELLHWPWNSDEPTERGWISLIPFLIPRYHHGAVFVSGKLVVAGGDNEGSAECFTPPCTEFPEGQWTSIRRVHDGVKLAGFVPFGEGLLIVCMCEPAIFLRLFIVRRIKKATGYSLYLRKNPSSNYGLTTLNLSEN